MAAVVAAAPQVLVDESTRLANSTVARIVTASKGGSLSDPTIKKQCVEKLQKINGELKSRIADADALAAHEAMKSGITGALGCDHTKLISVLCTRTKAALQRTRAAYRKAYDKDLAKEVASETSGPEWKSTGASGAPDNSSLSHFSATTLPSWLRSSGEEPSLRADKELRRENAVVVLLRYVCASDVYVRALLEDSFWSG